MPITRRSLASLVAGAATTLAAPHVRAQGAGTVKVGVYAPFSGGYATYGRQFRQAIELYQAQNGPRAGSTAVEVVYRDESAADPQRSRTVAQELVVRERVDFLAGVQFTPNALGIAPVATEAKKPFIIFNAATSVITRRSPYIARTSFTISQVTLPVAQWAARNGVREALIAVSDYAPGHDARDAFRQAFTAAGGTIKDVTLIPLNVVDFAPYIQAILDQHPGAVYVFMPAGVASVGFMKAFADLGAHRAGIKLLGTGETDEVDLPAIGESALGVITGYHYSLSLDTPRNRDFVAAYRRQHGADAIPNFLSVAAYDGLHAIYEVVRRLGGQIDGDRAMEILKGMQIDSPRGPVIIDAAERDIVQDVYIRRVERQGSLLVNLAFDKFEQVHDPWKAQNPA
jgi:branched-chain amino acid transport system substrate-binding protein